MQPTKSMSRIAILVLCVTLTPLVALASPGVAPQQPAGNVEAALWQALAAGETSDIIVEFGLQADLSAAYAMDWQARGRYTVDTLRAVADYVQAPASAFLGAKGLRHQTFLAGNELYVWGADLDVAQGLAALPHVDFVRAPRTYTLDPIIEPEVLPEATLAWGVADTHADDFWATFGIQGDGIVVANIDTGVQWDHPALDQAYRCPGNPGSATCWADPSNICGGTPCDNNGHGTHTMGTMVADDDPSLTYTAGMAPNATWIACKGCETNSCSDYALNACADWILAPGGNPANRPHIVNNSWGGGSGDTWYLSKVNAWRAAGIFPAFSAGNNGWRCGTLGSPGDYQASFASAAHDANRAVASFSSRGPSDFGHEPYTKPNLSAPGVSICSTVPTDGWTCGYSGTSMASPHTAGAVALLWSCTPDLVGQVDQTFQALQGSADAPPAGNCLAPPDGEGNYTYGYGYLNVLAAGTSWCGGAPTPPAAPSNLQATAVSYQQIALSWTDNADNETGFEIQRSVEGGASALLDTVGANVTSYADSGLDPDTTYTYQVRAVNGAGASAYSNVASATTPSEPPPGAMHVGDLDGVKSSQNRNFWWASVTALVHDGDHQPVANATVSGAWSGGASGTGSCLTDASGQCTVLSPKVPASAGSVTFAVTDVAHASLAYDAGLNHDPDGDCDGTTILVYREAPVNQPPVASFTYACTDLTCTFDGTGSIDPDGGDIVTFDWAFGDLATGSGAQVEHTYPAADIYTVVLTVTDDEGDTGTTSQDVSVGMPPGVMYVFDIAMSGGSAGVNRYATAVVTIYDTGGNPVAGAAVVGTWSGAYAAGVQGTTGADGTVAFTSGKVKQANATFTFTVDNVSKAGYSYDPGLNNESNDSITVP
jgi:subtilisin family serine protease